MKHFIDAKGRLGVVTETREDGIFVRPWDQPYVIDDTQGVTGVATAQLITATWWSLEPDGSFRGAWFDSPLNAYSRGFLVDAAALMGRVKSDAKTLAARENAKQPRPNAQGKKKPRKAKE